MENISLFPHSHQHSLSLDLLLIAILTPWGAVSSWLWSAFSWWLVMLITLSNTCGPFVCLLGKLSNLVLCPLPIFSFIHDRACTCPRQRAMSDLHRVWSTSSSPPASWILNTYVCMCPACARSTGAGNPNCSRPRGFRCWSLVLYLPCRWGWACPFLTWLFMLFPLLCCCWVEEHTCFLIF